MLSTKSAKVEELVSIRPLKRKSVEILSALHKLTIVVALPNAIPRSNWLIYLGDKAVFSASTSCVYFVFALASFNLLPIFLLKFF